MIFMPQETCAAGDFLHASCAYAHITARASIDSRVAREPRTMCSLRVVIGRIERGSMAGGSGRRARASRAAVREHSLRIADGASSSAALNRLSADHPRGAERAYLQRSKSPAASRAVMALMKLA